MNSNSKIKSNSSSVNKIIACDKFSGFFKRREGLLGDCQYFWENKGLRVELQLAENRNDVQWMCIEIVTTEAASTSIQECLDIFWSLISDSPSVITGACMDYINACGKIENTICSPGWTFNVPTRHHGRFQFQVTGAGV